MPKIHIEGMGLMGSLIACGLDNEGLDFTWHDIKAKVNAWEASTGCVFPTGDERERADHRTWVNLIANRYGVGEWVGEFAELAVWTYLSKNPPHEGAKAGVQAIERFGELTVSNMHTVQVNVPALVLATRHRFGTERKERHPTRSELIVSHGFKRAVRYGWGWSAQVELLLSDELEAACSGARPCLYLRKGYLMYYAYPFPGTDRYVVGTQNVSQKTPKERETDIPYHKWLDHLQATVGDHVAVKTLHTATMRQGWRPYGEDGVKDIVRTKREPRTYFVKPQSGNGLRHFPSTYMALRKAMTR
jgi:hypothetical protein